MILCRFGIVVYTPILSLSKAGQNTQSPAKVLIKEEFLIGVSFYCNIFRKAL